jgi:predicted aspartyl protease
MFSYSTEFEPAAPCLDLVVAHPENQASQQTVFVQVDTGADISVIPRDVMVALNLPRASEITIEGYDEIQSQVTVYFARLSVGRFSFRRVPLIALERETGLIGRDLLNLLVTTLDGPNLQFDFSTTPATSLPPPASSPNKP